MQLPAALTVPSLDPAGVGRVRRLCDAIVESARIGLDAGMLVDSLNDTTANDFTVQDVLEGTAALGSDVFAAFAICPPAPRVDAPLEVWAELVRRIRERDGTKFECAWWIELLAQASDRDDVARAILGDGTRSPDEIAAELLQPPT
jgi:hypothetical protein